MHRRVWGGGGIGIGIGLQGYCFVELFGHAQLADDSQGHLASGLAVQMRARARGWELSTPKWDYRRWAPPTCLASAPIKNDVIGRGLRLEVYIIFNMVCRKLAPDGNSALAFSHLVGDPLAIGGCLQVREYSRFAAVAKRFGKWRLADCICVRLRSCPSATGFR